MIFLIILLISLIQQFSTQTVYEEKCFDVDSTDSKLECSSFNSFYNIYESNTTSLDSKQDRYLIERINNIRILTILKLNKNDDGKGTFYAKETVNGNNTNVYNTLIYS
jgi:hypothetical protein